MAHQTRQSTTTKLPIPRKGTKYIVRAASHHKNSVPVVIAVRDMLKLAKTVKEVKSMINSKLLKLNDKPVKDIKESIKLFNIFLADKPYTLTISPNHKFSLTPTKSPSSRLCKIVNKNLISKDTTQLNFHDGSNTLVPSKDNKFKVHDSITLDFKSKIKSHIPLEKGKQVFVFSGKYSGNEGFLVSTKNKLVKIKLKDKENEVELPVQNIIAQ